MIKDFINQQKLAGHQIILMFLKMKPWLTLMENICGYQKTKWVMMLSIVEFFILFGNDKKIIPGNTFGINNEIQTNEHYS